MNKKWIILIMLLVITLPVAYYLISPLWRTVEVQEESPLDQVIINDRMEMMSEEEKEQFEQKVMEANKNVMAMEESMPTAARLLAQGGFMPRAHEVMGKALLIEQGNSKILRFENFETINGPNLHIYLASTLGEEDYIDLGEIKATKGNVNYKIPAGIDTKKYNKVLVWCVPFKILFSYAILN